MNDNKRVTLIGETLISLIGPLDHPIDRGTPLGMTFAGAEVNVSIALARLGHQARWASVLGDDLFGRIVHRGLRGEGVDTSAIQISNSGPTALMIKNRRAGGEPEVFYYRRGSAMSQAGISTFPEATWSDARVLYLTGITPALSPSCREMIEHVVTQAHARGVEIWLDPNHRRKLWTDEEARKTLMGLMPQTSLVLAGLGEGEMLTGSQEAKTIAAALLDAGAPRVIVKTGTDGSHYFDAREQFHVPAFAIERVIDPIGAGDAFGAGVLSARLEGLGWPEALLRGNALGAMACLTQGDWEGLPTRRELDDFLARRSECVR